MSDEFLTARFEEHRPHLRAVAYRMLGSADQADDALQEAWLRVNRHGTDGVENLGGWLTTVVARICLTMLQSRKIRREEPLEAYAPAAQDAGPADPAREAELAESVGLAMLVVLDTLAPAERLAFVLHDMFAVPFEDIAGIVDRSPAATRQLASRARRRLQGAQPDGPVDGARRREVVDAFLTASREGRFDALLSLLDPDVVVRGDAASVRLGGVAAVHGRQGVAEMFVGRAQAAQLALIDGVPGAMWAPGGTVRAVLLFTVVGGQVAAIEMVADPEDLGALEIQPL